MLSWGMEDEDYALKCWLMGHSMLVDPGLRVIAHRFVTEHREYTIPFEHLLMNRIRLARRSFEREVWEDWCWRHRTFYGPKVWSSAWRLFERNRESVEADREYFLRVRPHSVYQYAAQFDLAWPLTLAGLPLIPRPRYSSGPGIQLLTRGATRSPSPDRVSSLSRPTRRRISGRSRPARRRTSRRSRRARAPDFAACTTSEAPDYAAFTTSEAPDFRGVHDERGAGLRGVHDERGTRFWPRFRGRVGRATG